MDAFEQLGEDLVTANRILAHHGVVDSFGHVSVRDPRDAGRFVLSRARAPGCVERGDLMTFTHAGEVVGPRPGQPYSERFIHGGVYEARPEVGAVVHNHSQSVVPFGVQGRRRLRPIMHMCAPIGNDIPTWDISHRFGTTNLLVTSSEMGRDLAECLGARNVALMRGHGCVVVGRSLREAVFTAVYLEINARMLIAAHSLGGDDLVALSDGEVDAVSSGRAGFTLERAWEDWCRQTDRPYRPLARDTGPGFSRTD